MPHFPKPFSKRGSGVWYVEIDRKQVNLGPDRDEAFRRYQLMAQPQPKRVAADSSLSDVNAFLDWRSKHRATDTYLWYDDGPASAFPCPAVDRRSRGLGQLPSPERHTSGEAGVQMGRRAGLHR